MNKAYLYTSVTDNKLGYDYMSVIDEIIKREPSYHLLYVLVFIYIYTFMFHVAFSISQTFIS